jgi:hypothetical protein
MNWSEVFEKRYEIHQKWPKIWDLPLVHKRFELAIEHLAHPDRLLDLGADRREWETRLKRVWPDLVYRSMDINRGQRHDWYDLKDVDETFEALLCLEVIEHLPREEGCELLSRAHALLETGGRLVLTTPNIWCPPNYLRDATHVQPWAYDEIGGLLLSLGFQVTGMYRLWNAAFLDRCFRLSLGHWLHRYIGIDFARTLFVAARKT